MGEACDGGDWISFVSAGFFFRALVKHRSTQRASLSTMAYVYIGKG